DLSLIIKSIKWLFKKDAPFYIKPQMDTGFAKWMIGFMLNAGHKKVLRSVEARHRLLSTSKELYLRFFKDENINCNWSPKGFLYLYKTEKSFEGFRRENDFLKNYGYEASPYTGQALKTLEPAVKDSVFGGWLQPLDSWLKPDELVAGLKSLLRQQGCDIFENKEVDVFMGKAKLESVSALSGEKYAARQFVLAAGSWSPLLKKQTRLHIPIVPAKGYSLTMKKPRLAPRYPSYCTERKVVATPFENSYRLGSTLEFAGYDSSINRPRLEALKTGAAEYLVEPFSDEIYEEWFGWRPMTPDGVPIIGRSPVHSNLWLACGHNMMGVSMAPATGKLVSELMTGKETHIDAGAYSFLRF
ncbi:MAG TPA: FAD-dependent oxidoreductase, partial [Bacteroidetes bacterium]|nr:FAD-dependent oxidoreductase [Bacteroidota bacterium]